MNLRPLGYEPNELPGCSTPQSQHNASAYLGSNPTLFQYKMSLKAVFDSKAR